MGYYPYYCPPTKIVKDFLAAEEYYAALRILLQMAKYARDRKVVLPIIWHGDLMPRHKSAIEAFEEFHGQEVIFLEQGTYYQKRNSYIEFCALVEEARGAEPTHRQSREDHLSALSDFFLGDPANDCVRTLLKERIDAR